MSYWLDKNYVSMASSHLPLFKWQNDTTANFRCVYCGDSMKNERKCRAFFIGDGKSFKYYCHNCTVSRSLKQFLFEIVPHLYGEYNLERIKELGAYKPDKAHATSDMASTDVRAKLPKSVADHRICTLRELSADHIAVKYAKKRQLPDFSYDILGYADNYRDFAAKYLTSDELDRLPADKRIIIPIKDKGKNLVAFQGRALGSSQLRYITNKIDQQAILLFGEDRLDTNQKSIVVEGPFDSLFLPNCIAMIGTNLKSVKGSVVVYDNQPRNRDVVRKYQQAIKAGLKVCIWTKVPEELKDINDMVLAGQKPEDITTFIYNNSYTGVEAQARLFQWKKVTL